MNVALLIHDKVEHYNVISNTIIETGDNVLIFENKVTFSELISCEIDLILIYGYRHLLNKQFRDKFKNKIINLHPSYLPFGRGCYPNFGVLLMIHQRVYHFILLMRVLTLETFFFRENIHLIKN